MGKTKTNYIVDNLDLLTNLTWKELETIYYLRIPTLKDYSNTLPEIPAIPKEESKKKSGLEKQVTKSDGEIGAQLIQPTTTPKASTEAAGQQALPTWLAQELSSPAFVS